MKNWRYVTGLLLIALTAIATFVMGLTLFTAIQTETGVTVTDQTTTNSVPKDTDRVARKYSDISFDPKPYIVASVISETNGVSLIRVRETDLRDEYPHKFALMFSTPTNGQMVTLMKANYPIWQLSGKVIDGNFAAIAFPVKATPAVKTPAPPQPAPAQSLRIIEN